MTDKIETRLGSLNFSMAFRTRLQSKSFTTTSTSSAVQTYLLAIPAVSQAANRNAIRELGPMNTVVPIFEQLMDSRSIFLTPNGNTVYSWVIDLGITGPDKGKGGKYLIFPPGYKGKVPKGYTVVNLSGSMRGCGNGVMVRLLRHRQTKGAETDGLDLTLPRHISTLPIVAYVRFCCNWILKNVRSSLKFYYQRHKLPG